MAATRVKRTAPRTKSAPKKECIRLSSGGARFAWFGYAYCRQTKGKWGRGYGPGGRLGAPLAAEAWQLRDIISPLLKTKPSQWKDVDAKDPWPDIQEWVLRDPKFGTIGGPRVYREAYIQMPKKQGKSTLSSGLALYFLLFDDEPGAEIYSIAAAKPQAKIVFEQARQMASRSPLIADQVEIYKDVIYHKESESIYRALAADADYNEGFNPFVVINDELHAHKSREMYDAMTSHLHTGAREDPLVVTITNPGTDTESICYEVYSQAKEVLEGRPDCRQDLFAYVPELAENEIYDETKWKKVSPSSWTTIEGIKAARKQYPEYVFLRRYLNVWTEAEEAWLPYEFWEAAGDEKVDLPKGTPIVLAADMGMTKDTTGLGWAGVREDCTCGKVKTLILTDRTGHAPDCPYGLIVVRAHIWGIRQRNRALDPPCHELLKQKRFPIKLLKEYVVDELLPNYQLHEFVYDKWYMEQLAQELSDEGLNMVEFPQTDQRMIPASENLWNVIARDNILRHDPEDKILMRHVMAGVVDETGRGWRINKKKTSRPMDGLTVILMAVDRLLYYIREGAPSFSLL